jgi:isoleucyl-tRNA synthetase
MIESRPDWCVSRQRSWGTPIPFFIHKETRELHPRTLELLEEVAKKVAKEGVEAWFSSPVQDWLQDDANDYDKINDVLDVWFDSGVAHFCVLQRRSELQFPADMVLEGSDQYRGWFQSMLLTAVAMQKKEKDVILSRSPERSEVAAKNLKTEILRRSAPQNDIVTAPYKTVITHGFTVDEKGRKMSKSLGNVIAPEKVWNTLGADILRLWTASTDYTAEIAVSDEILKRMTEAYRRIRNTARYLLSNLFDFNPETDLIAPEKMLSLDRWAVDRAHLLQEEIIKAYDNYQFHVIFQKLQNFCIVDMGGFYLDVIKDRQYTMKKNSIGRRSAQTAMFHIISAMVRWIAPILSFTAEEIWRYIPGQHAKSVFLSEWYEGLSTMTLENDPITQFERHSFWNTLLKIREAVNKEIEKSRNEGGLGSALEAEIQLFAKPNSALAKQLSILQDELRFVLITSSAQFFPQDNPADAVLVKIDDEELWVKVKVSENLKCIRCWHRRADVGKNSEYPEICLRCVENVEGMGEVRKFA